MEQFIIIMLALVIISVATLTAVVYMLAKHGISFTVQHLDDPARATKEEQAKKEYEAFIESETYKSEQSMDAFSEMLKNINALVYDTPLEEENDGQQ